MNRYLNLLDFTIHSFLRRKGKNLSLLLLFSYLIFLFTSVLLLTGAIKKEARRGVSALPDITVQRLMAGRHYPIPASYTERLDEIFGIQKIESRIWGYYLDSATQANYTIIGYDSEKDTWKESLGLITNQGGKEEKLERGKAILGEGIMKARYLRPGKKFALRTYDFKVRSFRVAGSFKGITNLQTYDVILLSMEDAREILGMEKGLATDLGVYVYNKNEVTRIAKKITEVLPGIRVMVKSQLARTYDTVYSWKSGYVLITLVACLLAFAMVVWDKASGLSAEEKREIGILKAMGWDTTDILIMKFWEGLGISLPSFMIGIIASYIYTFLLGAPLLRYVIIGWSVLYPPFTFTPSLDFNQLLVLLFLTVIPYIISTIIPSWKA
ncbi:MAG: FtsX-like permease family protein, partial [Desulfatiglandales bacterium]|nr:FtsX-like permease family protein [Desulfatiglandales bacterium]